MVWATGLLWKAWPLWIGSRRSTACRAFLASLIEDFADEWLTKAMFSYRWAYDADIQYASLWIADDFFPAQKGAARAAAAKRFAKRQIERMPLVGCTPQNAPIIEATYTRTLDLLETHVGLHDHLQSGAM